MVAFDRLCTSSFPLDLRCLKQVLFCFNDLLIAEIRLEECLAGALQQYPNWWTGFGENEGNDQQPQKSYHPDKENTVVRRW